MLMFQREVAERIVATPGSKTYGRLSVLAGWRTQAKILFDVQPHGLRAAAEGDLVGGAARCRAPAPLACDAQRLATRDRSRLRPAPQDAAAEPEDARRRSGRAARRRRHRPDRAAEDIPVEGFVALARIRLCAQYAHHPPSSCRRMTQMHRQSLTAYGAPLCETVAEAPRPQGTEVLVRIARCGVCHSDLHMQDGYFRSATASSSTCAPAARCRSRSAMRSPARSRALGRTPTPKPGAAVAVYPWIGCGQCPACRAGDENICAAPRHLGITVDGGYATHVLVPHARYLIDYAPLSAAYAGALMCSGLTAYAALKRLADRAGARAAAAGRRSAASG